MGSKQQYHHPTVAYKLSCSSFPSSQYLSLLASNSNSNSESKSDATKTSSSKKANPPARKNLLWFGFFLHGVVPTIAGGPLERVQILLQCQGEMIKSGRLSEPYGGIQDCFKRVVRNEGFFSLWRGSFTSLIYRLPYQHFSAVLLAFYYNRLFNIKIQSIENWKWRTGKFVSSVAAGASASFFIYSLDYARTRLSNDIIIDKGSKRQFNGLFDVYRQTLESEGIKGLYRGFNVHCFHITVNHGFKLFGFTALYYMALSKKLQKNAVLPPLVFMVANMAFAMSYPLDTVRRRMMMTSGEAYQYKSASEVASQMLKNEGFKSFYKGCGASYLNSIVTSLATILLIRLVSGKRGDGKNEVSIAFKMNSAGDENPF